jgi:hypothetical protein
MLLSKIRLQSQNIVLIGIFTVFFIHFTMVSSATPMITDWGNSKTSNPQDIMFLADPGDTITFSIKVTESVNYKWTVNKIDKNINTPNLTWTVPNKKGIWEIHVNASNFNGEAHKEWVVSTLNASEAPQIFDYFADGSYSAHNETDPWGRNIQNWTISASTGDAPTANKMFVVGQDGTKRTYLAINTSSNRIIYGTWKFYSMVHGSNTDGLLEFGFISQAPYEYAQKYQYKASICYDATYHYYFFSRTPAVLSSGVSATHFATMNEDLANTNYHLKPDVWHEYTIIRTSDNVIRMYVDDRLMLNTFSDAWVGNYSQADYIFFSITGNPQAGTYSVFDGLQVYNDTYLFPDAGVTYNSALSEIEIGWNYNLSQINSLINNTSLFNYYTNNRTAYTNVNLTIVEGGKLVMDNETLVFNLAGGDGNKKFRLKNGASLDISNSTITTNNSYAFRWEITGDWVMQDYPIVGGGGFDEFEGSIKIKNSLINNSMNFDLDDPILLIIEDSTFKNIKEVNYCNRSYPRIDYYNDGLQTPASFEIWLADPLINISLRNITIIGATGNEIVRFAGGDPWALQRLIDSNITNARLELIRTGKINFGYGNNNIWPERTNMYTNCTLEAINTKFSNYNLSSNRTQLNQKYYLDVLVQYSNGTPVSGAIVTVTNEIDPSVKADNLTLYQEFDETWAEGFNALNYVYRKWGGVWDNLTKRDDMETTTTGSDGHTPLPSNKSGTLVITDYSIINQNGTPIQRNYTYQITAEKGNRTGQVNGIDPNSTWYRSDPNTYQNTVLVILGTKTNYTFSLSQGWNLISVPIVNYTLTAEKLANLIGLTNVQYVLKRESADNYKSFIVGFSGASDNFAIEPDEGYYVYLKNSASFTIQGFMPEGRSVNLTKGWNLIGWTSLNTSDAKAAFIDPLAGNVKFVTKRNASTGEYQTYIVGISGPEYNFSIEPGNGYYVYVENDCTLPYGG